jgi:hypothetical protein
MTTIVTAFFDINRTTKGDGRKIDEYKNWLKVTLKLNCNMYIVTEPKFEEFFKEFRNHPNTKIKIINLSDLRYYKYYNDIKDILESYSYKTKIKDASRVECVLPEYNIIQYSKFHCLDMAITDNVFNSKYFFWVDAGISRFFLDVDISLTYPLAINFLERSKDTLIIQKRFDLEEYTIDEHFIWGSSNLLKGTMFGGTPYIINRISILLEDVFKNMILNKAMNNEQLALSIVWKNNKELFTIVNDNPHIHLILFKLLSLPM